jgi:stage II sporulation protein R
MKKFLQKHTLTLSMLLGAIVSVAVAGFASFAAECERIPAGILRLHILAESDSPADQAAKYALRDYILAEFADDLADCDTLEQAHARSLELLPEIEQSARSFAERDDISAEITQMFFPTRVYGRQTLPAGNYAALRITIGEGNGRNWWCIMFPALCLPAVSANSDNEVTPAINMPPEQEQKPQVRFAVYEMFARRFR